MFIQNTTSLATTFSPFDQAQGRSWMVTLRPFAAYTGGLARDRL
jgi:hypothetical protein